MEEASSSSNLKLPPLNSLGRPSLSLSQDAPRKSSYSSQPPPRSPLRSPGIQVQSRNPLSLRLYKVLGTNYDDALTKEALNTLSELYAPRAPAKGKEVSRGKDNATKPKQALNGGAIHREPRFQRASLVESVPGECAARARKGLRADMERKLAEGSRQFLEAFRELDQKLDDLQALADAMRASCDEAETQLGLTHDASQALLERASNLRQERQADNDVEEKRSIVTFFLSRFTLSAEEAEAITSRDVPVGSRFFAAMDRTAQIRSDCRTLMAGEDGPTKVGLDIMAATSACLEQGYEKIARWCMYELGQMGREPLVEVGPTVCEAVRRLRARPELLTECLTALSQTRQQTLLTAFTTALTHGGPGGLPRPIELHAHDPIRYVGDMLAWVHQTVAAEREFLEGLFGLKGDGHMVGSVRTFDCSTEEEDWIRELMDLAVAKLCVPLKESCIALYKIMNVLQFYMLTMRRTLGAEALLSAALQEITNIAYQNFYDAVEAQGKALLRVVLDPNDPALTPPMAILDHAQIIREIATVYESSLLGDGEEQDFARVLDVMIDPALQMCVETGEGKQKQRPRWDNTVYLLNCYTYLQGILEPFAFTEEKRKVLQKTIDDQVAALTEEHYVDLMADAGIYPASLICQKYAEGAADEPLSHVPSMQPAELQRALHTFSTWLSGVGVVESPRLGHLVVQKLNQDIHRAALERMARAYKLICEEVRKPANRYEAAATLLGSERPFGQIHLLWQIFGLEGDVP
ncbi:oligomeric complex COG6 [Fistulina hepatica ATCC 64428]|uniref:Conserved oligomeric Golgi complex subunit 6 n=1 Tax=Fistulina hepatica ATCC 64428 TaxID=1128425 RepID=A0A0D7A8E9_9AGAR|nr:oligomeric complex COG6 [Fistulina hepatica ATCC 64428]